MITYEEKKTRVEELTEKLKDSVGIYLANFHGINVAGITELRKSFRASGAKMIVVKNTLLKRVFNECKVKGLDDYLVGPTAVVISQEDPIAPAKIIVEFQKNFKDMLSVKVVSIDSELYSGDKIKELSKMPGKKELQCQIVSLALSPASNLISVLNGTGSLIAGQIEAQIEKLEKEKK